MKFIITTAKVPSNNTQAYDIIGADSDGLYTVKICRCYDREWAFRVLSLLNAKAQQEATEQ